MAARSRVENPQPDDIEVRMASQHVSDSEEDSETFNLSAQKLRSILHSRLQKNHSFIPRKTGILDLHISRSIEHAFSMAAEGPNLAGDDISTPFSYDGNNQSSTGTNHISVYSFDAIQELRRSSRRRNISFYQQHIYTIDSVSYTLRISLEDATELVKQRPEIIQMYHMGKLEKYLRNGFKLDEPQKSQSPKTNKKTNKVKNIAFKGTQGTKNQFSPSNSEKDLSSSYSSSDSADDSDTENGDESKLKETSFAFRGRIYRDLDAVSRASGLPKSFFSMGKKRSARPAVTKRSPVVQRPGVAKKKKAIAGQNDSFIKGNIFTTGPEAQEILATPSIISDENVSDEPSDDEDVDVLEYSKYDREHPNSRGSQQFDAYEVAAQYDGRYLDDYDQTDDEVGYQSEDDVMFMGQKQVQQSLSNDQASLFHDYEDDKEPAFIHEGIHNEIEQKRTHLKSGLIDAMLSRSGRSSGSAKPSTTTRPQKGLTQPGRFQQDTNRKRFRAHSAKQPRTRRQKAKDGTRQLKRISRIQAISRAESNSIVTQKERQKAKSEKLTKKPRKSSLWVNPALSNYQNGVSTIIYEGLVYDNPIGNSGNVFKPQNQTAADTSSDDQGIGISNGFEWSFKNSSSYKLLFTGTKVNVEPTYSFSLSGKSILLSNYRPDCLEQIKLFFKTLLDPQSIKFATNLFEKVDSVLMFCSSLSVNEIRSLVVIIDDFVLRIESRIRSKGHVKDIELFLLSCSTLFYHLCSFVFQQNHIQGYDLDSKLFSTLNIYTEVLCYISGSIVSKKIKDNGHFLQSFIIASQSSPKSFSSVIERCNIPDVQFLLTVCQMFTPLFPLWSPVIRLLKKKLDMPSISGIKDDINNIDLIKSRYGWRLNEDLLVIIYEILKANKFDNYHDEPSYPVIFTEIGLNKDTSLNIYLNLLVEYSKESSSLSGRFLEKITPVSKSTQLNISSFCNRINILLCLSSTFKKNFESRVDQILLNMDVRNRSILQRMIRAVEQLVKCNDKNGFPSMLKSLVYILEKCIHFNETDQIKQVILSLDDRSLHKQTKQNIITAIASFSKEPNLINALSQFIKGYVIQANDRKDLEFLKMHFSDINPSNNSGLWCIIHGKLVSNDLENWSRLLKFNDFEDEPFIYSYILKHSGQQIYQVERESFIIVLAKALTSFKTSGSLNSYIREIENVDPHLLPSKGVLVQSHKLQFATTLISKIMINETNYVKSRVLSFLLIHLKIQFEYSKGSLRFKTFLQNILEYIDKFTGEFPASLNDFWGLKALVGINTSIPYNEVSQRRAKVTFSEKLLSLEKLILKSYLQNSTPEVKNFFVEKPPQLGSMPSDISSSSFFEICCLISIHTDLLQRLPSCWVLLSTITTILRKALDEIKNLSSIDLFCIFKTFKLFRFILKFKHSQFVKYRCLTGINIYKIITSMLYCMEGTNDYPVLYEILFMFLSRDLLYHESRLDDEAGFLINLPQGISEMIIQANIQDDYASTFEVEQNKFVEEFEKFCFKMGFKEDALQNGPSENQELGLDFSFIEDVIN